MNFELLMKVKLSDLETPGVKTTINNICVVYYLKLLGKKIYRGFYGAWR